MGYSLAWLAAQGKPRESLLAELDLRPTGRSGEYPDDPMVGAPLAGGWYLLVARGCDHRMIADQALKRVSRSCRVVACSIEEHVMWSSATLWENGERVWSVSHQGDEDLHELTVEGALPDSFAGIRDDLLAKQAAEGGNDASVDYVFNIPLDLARSLTGFAHDENTGVLQSDGFEVMEQSGAPGTPTKPLWKIW